MKRETDDTRENGVYSASLARKGTLLQLAVLSGKCYNNMVTTKFQAVFNLEGKSKSMVLLTRQIARYLLRMQTYPAACG